MKLKEDIKKLHPYLDDEACVTICRRGGVARGVHSGKNKLQQKVTLASQMTKPSKKQINPNFTGSSYKKTDSTDIPTAIENKRIYGLVWFGKSANENFKFHG